MITEQDQQFYEENGYVVAKALFTSAEVARYREHFMALRGQSTYPGDEAGVDIGSDDPLVRFPRMIQMHHWDEASLQWMLDARLNQYLTALLGIEPFAVQTMLYFKPAGARGQALHQDNYYLRVQPSTCMAAWLALDDCDEENGCMQIVPGSHKWPLLCPQKADVSKSFTDVTVEVPVDQQVNPVVMEAGDVMFFNGSLIHGSFPNTSKDRFRRALIGHYIDGHAETVSKFYAPVVRMDGTPIEIEATPDGGPCGVWVDKNGAPRIELKDQFTEAATRE